LKSEYIKFLTHKESTRESKKDYLPNRMTMNHSQIREKARIEVLETVKEIHDYLLKKKEWFKAFQLV